MFPEKLSIIAIAVLPIVKPVVLETRDHVFAAFKVFEFTSVQFVGGKVVASKPSVNGRVAPVAPVTVNVDD